MKDIIRIWNRVAGKTYSAVHVQQPSRRGANPEAAERTGFDTSALEANFSECETLNSKFENDESFASRRNAIVNRLFEQKRSGHLTRLPKGVFLILMLGFFGIAAGCFILIAHPYDILFRLKVVLSDGGEIFNIWRKPEVDLYLRVYLFNVTNKEAFMEGREKINVVQVGPYVYKEELEHTNVTFHDNGTLSARPVHPLTWVEEMSEGRSEDDILVMPNIALLSIGDVVSKENIFTRFGLNALIKSTHTEALVQMTAKEFMFGYESSLVTLGNSFMPGWIKFDKLGLIDRMYDFEGDYETVFTGETDSDISGLIDTYRGSRHLPQWKGEHCSLVTNASDGTKFMSSSVEGEELKFFRKSLCRTANIRPVRKGYRNGLSANKYTFIDNLMDNGVTIPENKCYCRLGECLPAGLIDVTDCYYGFPIALSYPHFYNGSEYLQGQVDGLYPDPVKHESYFWIQPQSGLPLDVAVRFQINMALDDVSSIANCEKFANMVLPLLWFEIRMFKLPEKMANRFWLYLNALPVVEKASMYLLFLGGLALMVISVHKIVNRMYSKKFDRRSAMKHSNLTMKTEMWSANEKLNNNNRRSSRENFKSVYTPCEIPLNETNTNQGFLSSSNSDHTNSDDNDNTAEARSFLRSHSGKLKDLSNRLSDKFHDSLEALKDAVTNETNRLMVQRKNSKINAAYQDSSESSVDEPNGERKPSLKTYQMVPVSGSDDDDVAKSASNNYLEVIDDAPGFTGPETAEKKDRFAVIERKISRMSSLDSIKTPKQFVRMYSVDHIDFGPNPAETLSRLPHLQEETI